MGARLAPARPAPQVPLMEVMAATPPPPVPCNGKVPSRHEHFWWVWRRRDATGGATPATSARVMQEGGGAGRGWEMGGGGNR